MTDTIRADFEQTMAANFARMGLNSDPSTWHKDSDGKYLSPLLEQHFVTWQAAHARYAPRAWFELNEQTKEILGRPNFSCSPIANGLRRIGQTIPNKAEEEQAAVIYWMLSMYQKHGDDWRKEAEKALIATKEPQ